MIGAVEAHPVEFLNRPGVRGKLILRTQAGREEPQPGACLILRVFGGMQREEIVPRMGQVVLENSLNGLRRPAIGRCMGLQRLRDALDVGLIRVDEGLYSFDGFLRLLSILPFMSLQDHGQAFRISFVPHDLVQHIFSGYLKVRFIGGERQGWGTLFVGFEHVNQPGLRLRNGAFAGAQEEAFQARGFQVPIDHDDALPALAIEPLRDVSQRHRAPDPSFI